MKNLWKWIREQDTLNKNAMDNTNIDAVVDTPAEVVTDDVVSAMDNVQVVTPVLVKTVELPII